jgi:hypothetical protein
MLMKTFGRTLLGAIALAAGPYCSALAQSASTYDPAQLPAFHGKVLQYDLSERGDVNGIILEDGTEVHTSTHRSSEIAAAVRSGDHVTIHGLKARELNLIRARSLTNDASSVTVVDNGDESHHDDRGGREGHGHHRGHRRDPEGRGALADVQGKIKMQLHDADGDLDGVLLTDGTIIHLPSQTATAMAVQLAAGRTVFVRGEVNSSDLGKVVNAKAIGSSANDLTQLPDRHER